MKVYALNFLQRRQKHTLERGCSETGFLPEKKEIRLLLLILYKDQFKAHEDIVLKPLILKVLEKKKQRIPFMIREYPS